MKIQLTIELDAELVDDDHPSGMTEEGDERVTDAINSIGVIVDGPTKVRD